MRRRDLLFLGSSLAAAYAARGGLSYAQQALVRGAVVIGVDRPGNLPPLSGAASGAREFGAWLETEGFEVKYYVDDVGPVTLQDIKDGVQDFTERGTLNQLLIYFSGHGFMRKYSEFWMLSGAPADPDQAIAVNEAIDLAERRSGIPNVIFVSDACRSRPDTIEAELVDGGQIFRADNITGVVSIIDEFYAALPGEPAFEVSVDKSTASYNGIFTACFLDAFKIPYDDMVKDVGGLRVVPNRKLRRYLVDEVSRRATAHDITLRQMPHSKVYSEDEIYIGRVSSSWQRTGSLHPVEATIVDVAQLQLERLQALRDVTESDAPLSEVGRLARVSGYNDAAELVFETGRIGQLLPADAETAFVVSGTEIVEVAGERPEIVVNPLSESASTSVVVHLPETPAASIALRFADGSGTILAALRGFVGNVTVDAAGVTNVSYEPSPHHPFHQDYQQERTRLEELRAAIATAARYGVFNIEGNRAERTAGAEQLANSIRVLKGLDPTLGIYAAYAYDEAGIQEQVDSVQSIMRSDLGVDIFDVALLSGSITDGLYVPICPVLSRGWHLLRSREVAVHPLVELVRPHVGDALWTTFKPAGMDIVMRTFRGEGLN